MSIDSQTVTLFGAVLLPLVVGVVSKNVAAKAVKSILLLSITALATLLARATLEDGKAVFTQELIQDGMVNWVVAIAAYYGLWKPTGVSETVNTRTADFGLTIKQEDAA